MRKWGKGMGTYSFRISIISEKLVKDGSLIFVR